MNAQIYEPFYSIASSLLWGWLFIVAGGLLIAGIFINGRWRHSPHLRHVTLCFAIVCYAMLGQMFWGDAGELLQGSTQEWLNCLLAFWCFHHVGKGRANEPSVQ